MTNPRPSVEVAREWLNAELSQPQLKGLLLDSLAALLDRTREEALEEAAKVALQARTYCSCGDREACQVCGGMAHLQRETSAAAIRNLKGTR